MPEELSNGAHINEGNIYIGRSTPVAVVQMFKEQFQNDFKLFLALRHKELVPGGRMILTFLGRKGEEMLMHGDVGSMWELLSVALQTLVQKVYKHIIFVALLFQKIGLLKCCSLGSSTLKLH